MFICVEEEVYLMFFKPIILLVCMVAVLSGCYAARESSTISQSQNNEEAMKSMYRTDIFEGTFTRRVKGASFIESKSGGKWQLDVADSDFYQRTWEADKKAKLLGYKDTVIGVSKVKLKGRLSEPSDKMKSLGYEAVLRVLEIHSVEPVKDVIPHDCMRKFIPCSSG